jgi:hypothetical protein
MKLAIMQPYLFPYIGYFQLINEVDKFVIYDDVNFINKGWINRNNILLGGQAFMFTIPLVQASQNKLINEIEISKEEKWKSKLLKTVQTAYGKAPYYQDAYPLIESVIMNTESNLSKYILHSLTAINRFLGITTTLEPSSTVYNNTVLKAQDRILDICKAEKASLYINPIGGQELYDRKTFEVENTELRFIRSKRVEYTQFKNEFVPWLSIIDLMMFNTPEQIRPYLKEFELI